MKEFKFNCPSCGQHIQAAQEWIGRQINCPGCGASFPIPKAKVASRDDVGTPAVLASPKKPSGTGAVAAPSASPDRSEPVPAASRADPAEGAPAKPGSAGASSEPVQVSRTAALTPEIKLDMVRAARRHIAKESSWMPGKLNGKNAYAAKKGELREEALVDVKSPEAARFSLVGAFLLELHRRHVTPTARGRRLLLDQEMPDAVQDVLLEQMSEEEREQADESLGHDQLMTLSHPQCLAVLDVLEEQYSQRMEQARAEKAKRKLGNVRLSDLVRKLEKRTRISSEEVATALFHELAEVRRRLDRVESRINPER